MDAQSHLNSLLFGSGYDDDYHEEGRRNRPLSKDNQDLLEDDQLLSRDYLEQIAPVGDHFLKPRGDKTERRFREQDELKHRFLYAAANSVEFSQSEFNQSSMVKERTPVKVNHQEEELRKKDARIELLELQLKGKVENERNVDIVLEEEVGKLQRDLQTSKKQVAARDALIKGQKKKIEQLQEQVDNNQRLMVDRERQLQVELAKLEERNNQLEEVLANRQSVFESLKSEMVDTVEKMSGLENTILSLKAENSSLKEQFELWNINEMKMRNLTGDRRMEQVASKRSLTNIYDRNGTELKKQYSTKTLLEDTPGRFQEERLRNELEEARKKVAYFEEGFLETKAEAEKLQRMNDEQKRVGANQLAQIDKLRNELKNKEVYLAELSKTLEKEKRGGSFKSDKEILALTNQLQEQKEKLAENDRRFRVQNEKKIEMEDQIKNLMIGITNKNKEVQDGEKLLTELRNRLSIESRKLEEAQKEINVLNAQLKEQRDKIRSLEKIEEDKVKGRKEEDRIDKLKQDVIRLEKAAGQREAMLKETKKKLDETNKKYSMSRTRINDLEDLLGAAKSELAAEKESQKKLLTTLNENKKKAMEAETLSNRLKILEAQLRSQKERSEEQQAKDEFDLNDRVEALEEILEVKERQNEQLKEVLEEMQEQLARNRQSSQTFNDQASHTEELQRLRYELEESETQLQNYRRQVEFREKSLQFLHNKLLKVQRQKLEIEADAKIFQSDLYASIDSQYLSENDMDSYNTKLTMRRDKFELMEQRLHALQDANKQLEERNHHLEDRLKDEIADKKKSTASLHQQVKQSLPTVASNDLRENCSCKIEVLMLKNRIKELTELLNRSYNGKLPPESLSPADTLEFLLETLRRVTRSDEMRKHLSKSTEFQELMRQICVRKGQQTHTRRLYA